MSTSPIRIAVTADDKYSATLSAAQARIKEFGVQSGAAGETMRRSFGEAKGAAALLGDEIGVKLNRHLRSVIASSQLLGPILEASFPLVAALGFIEVAERIPEAIEKATNALAGFGEESQKQYADALKQNEFLLTHFKTVGEGYKLLAELRKQASGVSQTRDAFNDPFFGVGQAFGTGGPSAALAALVTNVQTFNGSVAEGAKTEEQMMKTMERINELQVEQNKEAEKAANTARHGFLEALKDENKEADKFWQSWQKLNDEIDQSVEKLNQTAFSDIGKRFSSQRSQLAPWLDPVIGPPSGSPFRTDQAELLKIQQDQNESWRAARAILDQVEPPAEKYRTTIEELQTLLGQGRINQEQFNAALAQAKQHFDPLTIASEEFGKAMGDALKQGALMGRAWQDIFKSLLVTVAELIVRFTLLSKLESQYGKGGASGGWGGFITAIVGGFTGGHAGGGSVGPGQWGVAGENGPEPIFGGMSGLTVYPNRSMGGVVNNYVIHAEGAEIGVEQKILAAMKITERRAVAGAVAVMRENGARGRG